MRNTLLSRTTALWKNSAITKLWKRKRKFGVR